MRGLWALNAREVRRTDTKSWRAAALAILAKRGPRLVDTVASGALLHAINSNINHGGTDDVVVGEEAASSPRRLDQQGLGFEGYGSYPHSYDQYTPSDENATEVLLSGLFKGCAVPPRADPTSVEQTFALAAQELGRTTPSCSSQAASALLGEFNPGVCGQGCRNGLELAIANSTDGSATTGRCPNAAGLHALLLVHNGCMEYNYSLPLYSEYGETIGTSTASPTPSASTSTSQTATASGSSTASPSVSPSLSATSSASPSTTLTPTQSPSAFGTPTQSPSSSQSASSTASTSPSPSGTASVSPSGTPSVTPTVTPTASVTPSATKAPDVICPGAPLKHYIDQAIILTPEGFDRNNDADPRLFNFTSLWTAAADDEREIYSEYAEYAEYQQYERGEAVMPPFARYEYPRRIVEWQFDQNCARDCVLSEWSSPGACQVSKVNERSAACGSVGVQKRQRSIVVPANRWGKCVDPSDLSMFEDCIADPCPGESTILADTSIRGVSLQDIQQTATSIVESIAESLNEESEAENSNFRFRVRLVSIRGFDATPRQLQGDGQHERKSFHDDLAPEMGQLNEEAAEIQFNGNILQHSAMRRVLQSVNTGVVITTAISTNAQTSALAAAARQTVQSAMNSPVFQTKLVSKGLIPPTAVVLPPVVTVRSVNAAAGAATAANRPGASTRPPLADEQQRQSSVAPTVPEFSAAACFAEPSEDFSYLVAPPIVARVAPGDEIELELLPLRQERSPANALFESFVLSLPQQGRVSQLSEVYAKHQYPPKSGSQIHASDLPTQLIHHNTAAFRAPARHFRSKGAYGIMGFQTQYEGLPDLVAESEVYLTPPSGLIVIRSFVFDPEGWTVNNNGMGSGLGKGLGAVQHAAYAQGLLNRFIFAKDVDIQKQPNRSGRLEDRSVWYFSAPAQFLSHSRAAFGGSLSFTLGLSPDFGFEEVGQYSDSLPLVEFECSVCPTSSKVFRFYLPKAHWPQNDTSIEVVIPLVADAWMRGPPAWTDAGSSPRHPRVETRSLHKDANNPACECEFWRALHFMQNLRIFGDLTSAAETVKLDNVMFTVGPDGALRVNPGCLQAKIGAKSTSP